MSNAIFSAFHELILSLGLHWDKQLPLVEELPLLRHWHECFVHSMLILTTLSSGHHPHFMDEAQNQLLILNNWPTVTEKRGFVLKECIKCLIVISVLERFISIWNYLQCINLDARVVKAWSTRIYRGSRQFYHMHYPGQIMPVVLIFLADKWGL